MVPTEFLIGGTNEAASSGSRSAPPEGTAPGSPKGDSPRPMRWRWSLIWLAALGILGGMGTSALIWLISLPPQIDCSDPAQLTLDMERLYCAQEAAQTGELPKLIASLELLKQWDPDHPLYREGQRLAQEWSQQILTIARHRVKQGDLQGAEAALSHIPDSVPAYAEAQDALKRWRMYAKDADAIYAKAQTALRQKNWTVVSQQIVLMAEFERNYWEREQGADALAQQLGVEKQAWQVLLRAQNLAQSGTPAQLQQAIPVAQQIPAQSYAAAEAAASLSQWSNRLLTLGTQKWQQGKRVEALAILKLPEQVQDTPEVKELLAFSRAYQLADEALSWTWVPSIGSLLKLKEAVAAMEQIPASSPFYTQAQAHRQDWQAQYQDLVQIKYASLAAELGQRSTLTAAINQAMQVSPDRPRRVQAQTLIAFWNRQIERLEDQPQLDQAMQLARAGTIPSLQAAIQAASQIQLGRALRGRAQDLIATWRSQIQTLEDQPLFNRAVALADEGQLAQAIEVAAQIAPGRALYDDAQVAIREWRDRQIVNIQLAEDQPILDRATALAEAGNLAAAIDVASQIGSGRVLSGQARAAIERWQLQLNPPRPAADDSPQIDDLPLFETSPDPAAGIDPSDLKLAPTPLPPELITVPPPSTEPMPPNPPAATVQPHPVIVPEPAAPSPLPYEPALPEALPAPNNPSLLPTEAAPEPAG
ncbi:MAG: hypothetical protein IGS50_11915 [Synechococcales cyanobacterium C42_A2020_086]|nr:hypothetical protein [Synechococcales cyanobacterium C42_A2020_086]